MSSRPVVPKWHPLTEDDFHAVFLQSLARLIATHGEGQVALWLGVSVRQLRNIKAGSLPTADKIWNLLAYDPSAHDEMDRKFGARNVPADALCSSDPVAAKMAAVLTKAIEAECPDSHGGTTVTLHEIFRMDEAVLREVHRRLGGWVDQIDDARKPTLRAVHQ